MDMLGHNHGGIQANSRSWCGAGALARLGLDPGFAEAMIEYEVSSRIRQNSSCCRAEGDEQYRVFLLQMRKPPAISIFSDVSSRIHPAAGCGASIVPGSDEQTFPEKVMPKWELHHSRARARAPHNQSEPGEGAAVCRSYQAVAGGGARATLSPRSRPSPSVSARRRQSPYSRSSASGELARPSARARRASAGRRRFAPSFAA